METKIYQCICGKTFTSSQHFNGHKQGCSEHIINKYGSLETYYNIKNRNHNKGEKVRERNKLIKEIELQKWISEKHTCEKCGKVMTEKFGSGRFCSKSCANSHIKSDESKLKVSKTLSDKYADSLSYKKVKTDRKQINLEKYNQNPKLCEICGNALPYDKRDRRTCSKECTLQLQSVTMTNILAQKGLHRTVPKRYKYGTYKGVHCDSSWELAFLIYNLEHNRDIKRCEEHFEYILDGHRHNYFPDFIMEDIYYEIKNYYTNTVYAKIKQFPSNKRLVIIDGKQIRKYLNYCKNKYGDSFYHLYDRSCPSWMD